MNESIIPVTYSVAKTASRAKEFIDEISNHDLIACDFEVAIKYSASQIAHWQQLLQQETLTKLQRVDIQSKLSATALDHPSHCTITHCTISVSNDHSYVFILNNRSITNYVLNFLVTTPITQVWHNASYDFRFLYYFTGKFPINYEDSQILAKCLINHVETYKARTGLKELQGHKYGAWGISSDNFTLEQMYEPHVLQYAAIDSAATYDLWQFLQSQCDDIDATITATVLMEYHPTSDHYSPHDQLPAPVPAESTYLSRHFYENTAKFLIRDFVRIMHNGLNIDLAKVEQLEHTLDEQLSSVVERLAVNPLISQFQALQHTKLIQAYIDEQTSKLKPVEHFLKPFKHKDLIHRSYFMYIYGNRQGISQPTELIEGTTIPKWEARLVKKLAASRPLLQRLLDGELTDSNHIVAEAMLLLATHKSELYNRKYLDKITTPDVPIPPFNPNSSKQKQELFEWLGIESEATSKDTGLPSWDRDQIERINKTTTDDHVRDFTQAMIDQSFAAIVRNNFIEAFYKYTVDGRLHGTLKLLGAKTMRPTSNRPNFLNMPSTGSIFSKPIKQCFTAPAGKLVWSIDYSALENRVIANLAHEDTLIKLYQDNLDGHCVNSLYYFREEIAKYLELTGDLVIDATNYAKAVEEGHKELKAIRQRGKGPTFGLQYGAYPPKIAESIKCSLVEAESIFDRYHNELYSNVTKFREEVVLPAARSNGEVHMGLGAKLMTDDPKRDERTLVNSCSQFWSLLTLLAINKLHQIIDDEGLGSRIAVTNSIYDAIYGEVDNDPELVHWLNQTLPAIMIQPFIEGEIVHNEADLEIGIDWASFHKLDNSAILDDITTILSTLE